MATAIQPEQVEINASIPMGPTQEQFILSKARETCIVSSRGEGKSWAGFSGMVSHAIRQDPKIWPIPWVICRDTATNLHRTIVPGAYTWEGRCKSAMYAHIKEHVSHNRLDNETAKATMDSIQAARWVRETKRSNTEVLWLRTGQVDEKGREVWPVMAYLFGMDQVKDVSRFQSLELGGGWFEEPAPAADDDIGGGIQEKAWAVMLTSLRYPVDKPRAQIPMNPPDEDHWTWRRFVSDLEDPNEYALFRIPVGENKNLPDYYRTNIDEALKSNPDLHRRLVQGLPGFIQKGKRVAINFNEELHVSKVPLKFQKFGKDMYLLHDFGHSPCTIGMQQTSNGHYHFLFCFVGENMGMRQFLDNIIIPYMSTRIPSDVTMWHIGDPQGTVGSEVDITSSPVQEILRKLGGYWRSGPQKWDPRREAVHNALKETHMGTPLVQIDKANCRPLINALRGGWHYRTTNSGGTNEIPSKDVHCVDTKTEIMTKDGFKPYSDISVGDKVYGFDLKLRRLVLDEVEDIHVYNSKKYDVFHFGNREMSMVVTPEHKVVATHGRFDTGGPVRWENSGLVLASKINSAYGIPYSHGLMDEYRGKGYRVYSDAFVRLCAWVMTEGHFRRDGTGEIWVCQCEAHAEYCKQLQELASLFPNNITYRWENTQWSRRMNVIIKHELADYIKLLMPNKCPSFGMISNMRANERLKFIFESVKGDGSHKSGTLPVVPGNMNKKLFWSYFKGTSLYLCTSSQEEADSIQYISNFSGLRSRQMLHDKHHNDYRVSIKRYRSYFHFGKVKKELGEVDTVWCPQTKTSTWMARRDGQIFPTGNSHPGDSFSYGMAVLLGERAPVRKDLRVRSASYSKSTPSQEMPVGIPRL